MKVKTRHTKTGKIEIYDSFVANQNPDLEIIEEGDHLVEESKKTTQKIADKAELREARRQRRIRNRKQATKKEEVKKESTGRVARRLGYGEDEGDHVPHNMVSSIIANSK